jgi:hypothetical protein
LSFGLNYSTIPPCSQIDLKSYLPENRKMEALGSNPLVAYILMKSKDKSSSFLKSQIIII